MILDRQGTTASGAPLTVRTLDAADIPRLLDAHLAHKENRMLHADYRAEHSGSNCDPKWYGMTPADTAKHGNDPFALADALIKDGWPEGAARAKELAGALLDVLPPPASIKRRTKWSDEGDELDREKLDRGEVDIMWRTSRRDAVRAGPQTIGITFTWGGSCMLSAEQLFWGAAACIALSDVLEEAGYNTELFATFTAAAYSGTAATVVRVKRAGEALAPDAVAALFGHAAVFRTYGIPSTAGHPSSMGWGWGSVTPIGPVLERAQAQGLTDTWEVVLPMLTSKATAEKALREVLARMDEGAAV